MRKLIAVLISLSLLLACAGNLGAKSKSERVLQAMNLSCYEETGIVASKHIVILRIAKFGWCCDDSTDREGVLYYCYMLDLKNGLKAMVTKETLSPAGKLDKDIQEFHSQVKREIEKDGGVEALIQRFVEYQSYEDRMELITEYLLKIVLSEQGGD